MAIGNLGSIGNASLNNNKPCPLYYLCRYCQSGIRRVCCLFNSIILKGLKFCENYSCCNYFHCNNALNGYILPEYIPTKIILKKIHYSVKKPCNSFSSHFIPSFDISPIQKAKEQIEIIKKVNLDAISLRLSSIISNSPKKIIKDNYRVDLHQLLDFEGKIMLTTNIRDSICEKLLNNVDKFIEELIILKPDIITTFDANFYIDQPLFITLYQMFRILKANERLKDLDIYQIFLAPPLVYPFFEIMIELALKLNYKAIGIPLLEINRDRLKRYRSDLINSLNWFKMKNNFKSMLISTNPNSKLLVDCFSSQSWVKIKNGKNLTKKIKIIKWEKRLRECVTKSKNAYFQQQILRWI